MDDLLDLSWSDPATPGSSSGNAKPLLQPQPQSRASSTLSFDTLARAGGGAKPNYSLSSASTRTSSPLRPSGSGNASPAPRTTASNGSSGAGGDAFSSLLGPTQGKPKTNLTMAERSAQLAAERKAKAEEERGRWDHGDFWDKQLGSASGSTSPAPALAPTPPASKRDTLAPTLAPTALKPTSTSASTSSARNTPSPAKSGTFWDTPGLQPQPQSKQSKPSPPQDGFDGLDGLLQPSRSKASPAPAAAAAAPADPWDLDALSAAVSSKPPVAIEYAKYASEDDDLLGEFGCPPKPRPSGTSPAREPRRSSPPQRVDSPPPHIVGQIVEMGFSPAQARAALAATPTGLDVQAALDALLAQGGDDEMEMDDERVAREMQAREDRRRPRDVRNGGGGGSGRASPHTHGRDARDPRDSRGERTGTRPTHPGGDEFTEQADRIMAQASEIGASMLSKATSFWNTGKERAMKVYEEQRRALEAQNAAKKKPADGRPRWMVEAEERERGGDDAGASSSGFRDEFRDTDMPPSPPAPRRAKPAPAQQQPPPSSADTKQRVENLFADEPRKYVSRHRNRGRATPSGTPGAASPAPASTPRRAATPPPPRQLVPATPAQTSTAAQHKAKGNEHFKLGRYAEADAAYTSAITSLPAGHLHLVTLHNNRAATRLKLGEGVTAVEDCTAAIVIIGPAYHPSKEAPLPADMDVKLGDALVKATVKRAQAYEMGEKWRLALEDWERVLGFDAALAPAPGQKALASEGVRRAKRMIEGGSASSPKATTAAVPKAPKPAAPARPVDVSKSAAVSGMRAAAAAAEKEDEERAALKDAVDARIEAWKKGKETNLRALIASLDTVLWDEILSGGLKVGMHELVTDKQVKIKYMKVVARLHPDKLRAGATSVEQRMLANGVFGTLSEAWAAFNA